MKPGDLVLVKLPGLPRECDEIGMFIGNKNVRQAPLSANFYAKMCIVHYEGRTQLVHPHLLEKIK